jgi:hypothetical protein
MTIITTIVMPIRTKRIIAPIGGIDRLLLGFISYHRQNYIPCNDGSEAAHSQKEQQRNTRQNEDVFDFIAFPAPMFEFQGEHRNFGNQ